MSELNTASQLWDELEKRLHLRKSNGRDNSLYCDLRLQIGCPPEKGIKSFLKTSGLSAEQLLVAVLEIVSPFALMFNDIWGFLSDAFAPKAMETLRVRFGFDSEQIDFNLEQFREWAERANRTIGQALASTWNNDAYSNTFSMAWELLGVRRGQEIKGDWEGFDARRDLRLPDMPEMNHEIDGVLADLRSHCQGIIYRFRRNQESSLPSSYVWMTDFVPYLRKIIPILSDIPRERKDRALTIFRNEILPRMKEDASPLEQKEPLEILDLPFWKERWHTYEIWATVKTLQILAEYEPKLIVRDGYIAIDGQRTSAIAHLSAIRHPTACTVVQMQTPFNKPPRTAIRPDLSICFNDTLQAASRAVIVEFKHRLQLQLAHVKDVGTAYIEGSPNASGVILLNYDNAFAEEDHLQLPANVYLYENARPDVPDFEERYAKKLLELLRKATLCPLKQIAVLIDVSGSMDRSYEDASVQAYLQVLLSLPGVRCFTFNDGIVGSELKPGDEKRLVTHGDTDISTAINQLRDRGLLLDNVAVVSDGDFVDHNNHRPNLFGPQELPELLNWIRVTQG